MCRTTNGADERRLVRSVKATCVLQRCEPSYVNPAHSVEHASNSMHRSLCCGARRQVQSTCSSSNQCLIHSLGQAGAMPQTGPRPSRGLGRAAAAKLLHVVRRLGFDRVAQHHRVVSRLVCDVLQHRAQALPRSATRHAAAANVSNVLNTRSCTHCVRRTPAAHLVAWLRGRGRCCCCVAGGRVSSSCGRCGRSSNSSSRWRLFRDGGARLERRQHGGAALILGLGQACACAERRGRHAAEAQGTRAREDRGARRHTCIALPRLAACPAARTTRQRDIVEAVSTI